MTLVLSHPQPVDPSARAHLENGHSSIQNNRHTIRPRSPSVASSVQWVGRARILGSKQWQKMILLTVSMLGLQLVWSTEMAFASPFLLALGLGKSGMSMVFLAGPLSGLIVQPLIGTIADRTRSPWGRRRPFMIGGSLICACGLLLLGYCREVAAIFAYRGGEAHTTLSICLAVLGVYTLDFSINAVQAADRAIIVDVLPPSQQEEANAWAGRMLGLGSVVGFWIGNVDLVSIRFLAFFGDTQLKIISIIACIFLLATHTLTSYAVKERILISRGPTSIRGTSMDVSVEEASGGLPHNFSEPDLSLGTQGGEKGDSALQVVKRTLLEIWTTFRTLPAPIRRVCDIQAFSWIGWFPILFYSSTWVGEIYTRAHVGAGPLGEASEQVVFDAARAGSRALLVHAIVSFTTSIIAPFFVSPPRPDSHFPPQPSHRRTTSLEAFLRFSAWSGGLLGKFKKYMPTLPFPWLSIGLVWAFAHIFFSVLMAFTWFAASDVAFASLIVGLTGFPWAICQWAPFSLLGELILREGEQSSNGLRPVPMASRDPLLTPIQEEEDGDDREESALLKGEEVDVKEEAMRALGTGGPQSDGKAPGTTANPATQKTPNGRLSFEASQPRILQIRHSDSVDGDGEEGAAARAELLSSDSASLGSSWNGHTGLDRSSGSLDSHQFEDWNGEEEVDEGKADQAGVILGIHNIFVVIPQFIVTFASSIIFAFLEPGRSLVPGHGTAPAVLAPGNTTIPDGGGLRDGNTAGNVAARAGVWVATLVARQEVDSGERKDWDAIGLIFRLGGVSAAVAGWVTWRMIRQPKPGRIWAY